MTIKKTAVSTSIVLALGLASPLFAQTEENPAVIIDGDAVTIECITQAEVDMMEAADKEKLTLPVCEDVQTSGGEKNQGDSGVATQ